MASETGSSGTDKGSAKERKESALLNLLVNIILPALILMKLNQQLGASLALVLALLFPLAWGIWGLYRERRFSPISVLGVVSVLLTGGIGLLKLDPAWIAVKEALIPLIIGLVVAVSGWTRWSVLATLVEKLIDTRRVHQVLGERGFEAAYRKRLSVSNWILAASFLVSATTNYLLARLIVVSPAGSEAFNAELGRMTMLSFPVNVLPSLLVMILALVYLIRGIESLTGLKLDEVIHPHL